MLPLLIKPFGLVHLSLIGGMTLWGGLPGGVYMAAVPYVGRLLRGQPLVGGRPDPTRSMASAAFRARSHR